MSSSSESETAQHLKARVEKLTIQAEEWSECTAEWQKKWERMKSKREKAVKEATMYRDKVDSMTRQLFMWKEKYLQLEKENDRLKTQLKVLSPDGALLLSKSPSPGEVGPEHHKVCIKTTQHFVLTSWHLLFCETGGKHFICLMSAHNRGDNCLVYNYVCF